MQIARRVESVGGVVSAVYAFAASLILLFAPSVPVHFVSGTSDHLEILSRFQAWGSLSGVYYIWLKEAILLVFALVLAVVIARTAHTDSRQRSRYARAVLWIATACLITIVVAAFVVPMRILPFLVPSGVLALMASIAAGFMVRPQA